MEQQITIARPAADVFAYLADPAHLRHWVPQLRRDDADIPEDGLEADERAGTIRWSFAPAGTWRVTGAGTVSTLHLHLDGDTAAPSDPTEEETPAEAAEHGAEAALQSLKSHVERAGGGDPAEAGNDAPSALYGSSATMDPHI